MPAQKNWSKCSGHRSCGTPARSPAAVVPLPLPNASRCNWRNMCNGGVRCDVPVVYDDPTAGEEALVIERAARQPHQAPGVRCGR